MRLWRLLCGCARCLTLTIEAIVDLLDVAVCVCFGVAVVTTLLGRALRRSIEPPPGHVALWIAAAIGFATIILAACRHR